MWNFFKKKSYPMINGRKQPRLKANYLLRYVPIEGNMQEMTYVANTKDLSTGGLRFYSSRFLEEGTLLKIQVLVPPIDQTISAFARVVRVHTIRKHNQYEISLSYVEIDKKDHQLLNDFIGRCLEQKEAQHLFDHQDVVARTIKEKVA